MAVNPDAFKGQLGEVLQRIGVKLVGKLIITTAAMDDVPWLRIIGQDNYPPTNRTTDLF
jgi:hypothetical protein